MLLFVPSRWSVVCTHSTPIPLSPYPQVSAKMFSECTRWLYYPSLISTGLLVVQSDWHLRNTFLLFSLHFVRLIRQVL